MAPSVSVVLWKTEKEHSFNICIRSEDIFLICKIIWNLTVMQCRSWIPDYGVSSGSFQYRDKWKPWYVLNPTQCRWRQKQQHSYSSLNKKNKQWINTITEEDKPVIDVKRWINISVNPERPEGVIYLNQREKKKENNNNNIYITLFIKGKNSFDYTLYL